MPSSWTQSTAIGHNPYEKPFEYTRSSFEAWDVVESTFISGYVVLVIGVIAAAVTMKDYGVKKFMLSAQFVSHAALTAAAFGFGALAFNIIFTYQENDEQMSNHWFRAESEWLWPWAAAVCLMPMASSGLLATSLSLVDVGMSYTRLVKVIGGLFAVFELYESFADLANTGKGSVLWGFIATILGFLVVAIKGGVKPSGAVTYLIGLVIHLVAWIVLVAAPSGCWHVAAGQSFPALEHRSAEHVDCPYAEEFNQRGMFCIVTLISLVVLYAGVMARLAQESSIVGYSKQPALTDRTCCGA